MSLGVDDELGYLPVGLSVESLNCRVRLFSIHKIEDTGLVNTRLGWAGRHGQNAGQRPPKVGLNV